MMSFSKYIYELLIIVLDYHLFVAKLFSSSSVDIHYFVAFLQLRITHTCLENITKSQKQYFEGYLLKTRFTFQLSNDLRNLGEYDI